MLYMTMKKLLLILLITAGCGTYNTVSPPEPPVGDICISDDGKFLITSDGAFTITYILRTITEEIVFSGDYITHFVCNRFAGKSHICIIGYNVTDFVEVTGFITYEVVDEILFTPIAEGVTCEV